MGGEDLIRSAIILSAICLASALSTGARADETVKADDGRYIILRDNGTYEILKNKEESREYRKISLDDLKLDIGQLSGALIEVKGSIATFGDMVMIRDLKDMFDTNAVPADQSNLTRDERKYILKCQSGCKVTVRGEVGTVMFQEGVILHSLVR